MDFFRWAGAAVVAIPLGITASLNYVFGAHVFGEGSDNAWIYGVMFGAFTLCSTVGVFSLDSAFHERRWGRFVAAAAVSILALVASSTGSFLALMSHKDQVWRATQASDSRESDLMALRKRLADLPKARSVEAIQSEQGIIAEAQRGKHRTRDDVAKDIALVNELDRAREARRLNLQIAELSSKGGQAKPRATAAAEWIAKLFGAKSDEIGTYITAGFVVAAEIIGLLGLYAVIGRHAPAPSARMDQPQPVVVPTPVAQPIAQPEAKAPEVKTPVIQQPIEDPIAAFLDECTASADGMLATFSDVQAAHEKWAVTRGVDKPGTAFQLGAALKARGYSAVTTNGRKRAYSGIRLVA